MFLSSSSSRFSRLLSKTTTTLLERSPQSCQGYYRYYNHYVNRYSTNRISRLSTLTHVDNEGKARMVDVSEKQTSARVAVAEAVVDLGEEIFSLLEKNAASPKGDVLTVAQVAGVQAIKATASLIPLCHPLPLAHASVNLRLCAPRDIVIVASATTQAQTGVEMEALTGASVAALTVYDMCKAAGKGIVIKHVKLLKKSGGNSGKYQVAAYGEQNGS